MNRVKPVVLFAIFVLAIMMVLPAAGCAEADKSGGTEVEFDEGVAMPNVVRPVIILSGTDYEIGYQYFTQLVQINGKSLPSYQYDVETVYRRDKIHQDAYTEEEMQALGQFEAAITQYAPEWIDILHGMADGAKDSGLDITYTDLLLHYSLFERMSAWGPNTLGDEVFKDTATCSGFAAWGNTTTDGKLIAAGSGDDSEGNFAATIVVFPETGNNFVTQTFNLVGFGGFPDHPNMNNKGVIRVHHGGSTYTENEKISFNALPRGIADMHSIRFANSAEEAYDLFMSYAPGYDNAGAGVFYVDVGVAHDDASSPTHHALVAESRNPVAVRYPGDNGEGDFIYATNNWFCDNLPRDGIKTPHGGYWYEDSWYWWSVSRNNFIFDMLSQNQGKVDVEFMKMMYRVPSKVNEDKTLEEIDAAYWDGNGSDYKAAVGSLENSCIAVAVPDNGNNGTFYVSTGAVGGQTGPAYPGAHQYQPGKTWTFYQLKLAESPQAVAEAAKAEAKKNIDDAKKELDKAALENKVAQPLKEILSKARDKFAEGEKCLKDAEKHGEDAIYDISKATRCFAAAQAFANQVYEALVPPKTQP